METEPVSSNVKFPIEQEKKAGKWFSLNRNKRYERFGETIRFLTIEELQKLFSVMDNSEHKLLLRLCYEMGCRVGELVSIQLKHLDFLNHSVFIPAENTKTRQKRTSFISAELMSDIRDYLKRTGRMTKREGRILNLEDWLFKSRRFRGRHLTANRARQIFLHYIQKAELDRIYGKDDKGRALHRFTIHSLRHSHIMHHIHQHKIPIPIVQKQVGHHTLRATMVYCRPTEEMVKEEYKRARITQTQKAVDPKAMVWPGLPNVRD